MIRIPPNKTITVIDKDTIVECSTTPEETKKFLAELERKETEKRKNQKFVRSALRRLKRRR